MKNWPFGGGIVSRFLQRVCCVLEPVQKMFPSLGKRKTSERGCNASERISSDSGVVCQIVADVACEEMSSLPDVKRILVRTMCKVYGVTRTIFQGQ